MYDVLFAGGCIIDGSSRPRFQADVAISGDTIAAVEPAIAKNHAREFIDITGFYLTPGFVDLHTHSDFPLLLDARALSFAYQGVTTQVIGNCGFGPAPLNRPEDLRRNVFCFKEPYTPTWTDSQGFLHYMSERPFGTNIAVLVGHGALRSWAVGYENRPVTEFEQRKMRNELSQAMTNGAFGLSSGLEYAPGINADDAEIAALCSTVAEHGGLYTTHVRNRDIDFESGFSEAFRAARNSGVKLQISHAVPKYGASAHAATWLLDALRTERAATDVAGDVIPYEWGPTSLSVILPPKMLKSEPAQIAQMLESSQVRQAIIEQEKPFWLLLRDRRWEDILLYYSITYPHLMGKNAHEIGEYFNTDPFNGLLSVLQGERSAMFSALIMGRIKSRSDLEQILTDPAIGVISDAMSLATDGPLGDVIWSPGCFGWVPHYFAEFVGEGKLLDLETGVYKITGFPAERLGLTDRGIVRQGAKADLAIFHPSAIADRASIATPQRYAAGFKYVMCNGGFVVKGGEFAEQLHGTLL